MGRKKERLTEISCHCLARVTIDEGSNRRKGKPDSALQGYEEGTLWVNTEGVLGFQPSSNPDAAYVLARNGNTIIGTVNEKRMTGKAEKSGLVLDDIILDPDDPIAQRVASWFEAQGD